MKSVIDKGLALGVLEKKIGDYVVSDAASRDQINAYVQFLLEEMALLQLENASLKPHIPAIYK